MRNPDELLSIAQVAEELQHKITTQTITEWCRKGRLVATRIGKKWFVRFADLEAFLGKGGGSKKVKALAA